MTTVATAHGVDDCKYWYSWYLRSPLTQCSVVTYMIYRHPTSITMHGACGCVGSRLLQAIGLAKRLLVVYLDCTSYKAAPSSSTLLDSILNYSWLYILYGALLNGYNQIVPPYLPWIYCIITCIAQLGLALVYTPFHHGSACLSMGLPHSTVQDSSHTVHFANFFACAEDKAYSGGSVWYMMLLH